MSTRQERSDIYQSRIDQLEETLRQTAAVDGKFSFLRVASFIATGLVLAAAITTDGISAWLTLIPGVIFGVVVFIHERRLKTAKRNQQRIDFYQLGIDRINGNWAGKGIQGDIFQEKNHLFSHDLNLFGKASLFEKLCLCSTAFGRERLASWLNNPATPDIIQTRQQAVTELANDDTLSGIYAELDAEEHEHLEISTFTSWANGNISLYSPQLYFFSLFLGTLSIVGLVGWFLAILTPWVFIISLGINLFVNNVFAEKIDAVTEGISKKEKNLLKLADVLSIVEAKNYQSPLLKDITQKLDTAGQPASARILQISKLIYAYENSKSNLALWVFNLLLHTNLRQAMKIERWRQVAGASIPNWVDAAADFEALVSLSVFTYENCDYNFPEVCNDKTNFAATDLGHPLLNPAQCITNNVTLDSDKRLILISGSNMAGKSTFLRSVGINIVLAQMGAPVCAKELQLSSFALGCSIQIEDSLEEGISHFYAEILRLKSLVELTTASTLPVMYFFDEILHGTNSSDRCNGASAVIKSLAQSGALGFVTTHDLSLAKIADELGDMAENVHFADQFIDGKMTFDYKMKDGVVTHGNALQLMRSLGLEV